MPRLNPREAAAGPFGGFVAADRELREGPLDPILRELVKIRVSQLNGCLYCLEQHSTEARTLGESQARLDQLTVWAESDLFTPAERAALRYADVVTRSEPVEDELWAELQKHFSEQESGHLVVQVALINAFNRIGLPLRMRPPMREA